MQCPKSPSIAFTASLLCLGFACLPGGEISASTSTASEAHAQRELLDGIVAQVDNQIILLSEIDELRQVMAMQNPAFQKLPAKEQRREMLNRLIEEKVVVAKARQDTTIQINEKDLQPRVEQTFQNYVKQSGGEKALETALKQTTGMSPPQFKARLLDQMRDQAYRQRLQMKYVGDQEPSNQQVHEFYDRYKDSLPTQRDGIKLAHIQLRIQAGRVLDSTAQAKALEVIALLDKGQRFDSLSKTYSDDPTGKSGGDLGYTRKGTLDPDYEKAAFRLDAGDYTPKPVRSRYGYHVIKVTGKKDNEIRTSHILVRVIPSAEDSAKGKARADSLRAALRTDTNLIRASEAFAETARKLSDDRQTSALGGNLGWFQQDQIDEAYRAAVDSLAEGGITEPLLIGDSWNLFRVEHKTDQRRLTLQEDWAQIAQVAKNWQMGEKLKTLVVKWREGILVDDRLAGFTGLLENPKATGMETLQSEESPMLGPEPPPAKEEGAEDGQGKGADSETGP